MLLRTNNHVPSSRHTIMADELSRSFDVPVREAGVASALRSVVRRKTRTVTAVDGVTFSVDRGEVVAFLGPNGAGKTTTLKMLTGLLHPSSGQVQVLGYQPHRRRPEMLRQLALVMGQRTQLIWDLPPLDAFEVARAIYEVEGSTFRTRRQELCEWLEIEECVRRPTRNLSLGERMKCELALALIHGPSVVFLDEPTIGLDTTMQHRVRGFLQSWSQQHGTTMLLTSHDMADVEALCHRAIVIASGRLSFDGSLKRLARLVGAGSVVNVRMRTEQDADQFAVVLGQMAKPGSWSRDGRYLQVTAMDSVTDIAAAALAGGADDLQVRPVPLEEQIGTLYARLKTMGASSHSTTQRIPEEVIT